MTDRVLEIAGFLAQHGWSDAMQTPFDADFSTRRYARLLKDDNSRAILMDSDSVQQTEAFVDVAGLLRSMDISVPEIFAAHPDNGLVLMEDFGGRNFGALLDARNDAVPLYRRALNVLIHLHKNFDRAKAREIDLPLYGGALFASQVEMFIDYYFPHMRGRDTTPAEAEAFRAAWKQALRGVDALPQSLMLRDFMPDNLMDLKGREEWRSVGVLDFQDAGLGPAVYDLVSLCETVRRDGGGTVLPEMIAAYHLAVKPALSLEELENACALLSVQRHMRILGIIAKLVIKSGRSEKLAYVPRIWKYLNHLLRNEALGPVREWTANFMG